MAIYTNKEFKRVKKNNNSYLRILFFLTVLNSSSIFFVIRDESEKIEDSCKKVYAVKSCWQIFHRYLEIIFFKSPNNFRDSIRVLHSPLSTTTPTLLLE